MWVYHVAIVSAVIPYTVTSYLRRAQTGSKAWPDRWNTYVDRLRDHAAITCLCMFNMVRSR